MPVASLPVVRVAHASCVLVAASCRDELSLSAPRAVRLVVDTWIKDRARSYG